MDRKAVLRAFVFSGMVWFTMASVAQMAPSTAHAAAQTPAPAQTAAPAQVAPPVAAPAAVPLEQQLAALQAKMLDWAGSGHYRAQNAALAAAATGEQRVVFFGDSITEGWGRRGDDFFPGRPYVNRGISGQTSAQMVVRFHPDVVDLHPSVVVILAGTNDVAENTGPMTPEMTLDDFRAMVEMARANGIKVVICAIPPAGDFPWKKGLLEPAPKIRALNERLEAYCKGEGIVWVDYYTPLADASGAMKTGLSLDGVHPTAAGYAIMAPLAEAGIQKAMRK
jgi:lysophospholipase L1-like esterase